MRACLRAIAGSLYIIFLTSCQIEPAASSGDDDTTAKLTQSSSSAPRAASAGPQPAAAGTAAVATRKAEIPSNGEICDGKDNDGNGKIDDADVEADGVCDCLKIASMGRGGDSSDGALVFESWPNARAQNPVTALGDQKLTDQLLAPFDVLVVLNVATTPLSMKDTRPPHAAFGDDEVQVLTRWVQAGGGLITTIGYCADEALEVANVNRLLAPFGLGYSTTKLMLQGPVERWNAHPVTSGVQRVSTDNGVEPESAQGITLAFDADGHIALQASPTDSARVLVWGDEWITFASEWQAKADQQVERFWLNALTWLSRSQTCQTTGRP